MLENTPLWDAILLEQHSHSKYSSYLCKYYDNQPGLLTLAEELAGGNNTNNVAFVSHNNMENNAIRAKNPLDKGLKLWTYVK